MWHRRTVEQFLLDRRIEAEKAKAITGRLTLRANADGHFSNGFLKEIFDDRALAYSFAGEWAIDPLGKKYLSSDVNKSLPIGAVEAPNGSFS